MENLNLKLIELRAGLGLSQQQIADAVGITRSAYSNYEQGLREPDLKTLKKICITFDVSADYLLGIKD